MCTFNLDYTASGNVPTFGVGPYGTVKLELTGANTVLFTINLIGTDGGVDARMIDTGLGHMAFGFNNSNGGTVTLSNFTANGATSPVAYSQATPSSGISPFGDFSVGVKATCTGGSPCTGAGNVITFVATSSINFVNGLGDFINLSSGGSPNAYFASDIFYNGLTGAVGTTDPRIVITSTPEPQSAALLGTGLIGLAFAAKRTRRK